jgi:preprotein translocase SecE subunit
MVGAILTGMVVQAAVVSAFAQFAYPDARVLGLLNTSSAIALASGTACFAILIRNKKVILFTDEMVGEVVKVTFPTRQETVRATTTVVLTTLFTAGLLAVYDLIWKNVADVFLFTG